MSRRYLEDDDDDPMLSLVNLIDVFLVVVMIRRFADLTIGRPAICEAMTLICPP